MAERKSLGREIEWQQKDLGDEWISHGSTIRLKHAS